MKQHDELTQLTDDELARVGGGFLPLLGLIGAGSGLVGNILGGIGKKKAQQAEQLTAGLNGGNAGGGNANAGATGTDSGTGAAPTGGNMTAQPMAMAPSG